MHAKAMGSDKLYICDERLATFKRWPFPDSSRCNARSMAEAGFYSMSAGAEDADSARCFLCGKELDGWEESDDPWQEHRSHAKNCAFIQLNKREDEQLTVEFLSIAKQYMINEAKRRTERALEEIESRKRHVARKCFRKHKH